MLPNALCSRVRSLVISRLEFRCTIAAPIAARGGEQRACQIDAPPLKFAQAVADPAVGIMRENDGFEGLGKTPGVRETMLQSRSRSAAARENCFATYGICAKANVAFSGQTTILMHLSDQPFTLRL
jgi:hypothetical protein